MYMCKVSKIHLLAINGLMWTAIGTKISVTGISNYLKADPSGLWWMIPLSVLVFAGFRHPLPYPMIQSPN